MILTPDSARQGEATQRVVEWLQYAFDVMAEGDEAVRTKLTPNPFYRRTLSEGVVDSVLKAIEYDVIQYELDHYPAYHDNAQGKLPGERLVRPGFDELPYEARLCVVQGLDEILQGYRVEAE